MPKQNKKIKLYRHSSQYYRLIKNKQSEDPSRSPLNYGASTSGKCGDIQIPNDEEHNIDESLNEKICFDSSHEHENFIDETDQILIDEVNEQLSLLEELRKWALSHRVTIAAVSDLLKILREHGKSELPKDGRTLLKTPASVEITKMGEGKFWYWGLENSSSTVLSNTCKLPSTITLIFNIDGMSPFNSSMHQFWPISCLIHELRNIKPMVIAIYYGEGKPALSHFFTEFVKEINKIIDNGLNINGQKINVKIRCFVCDTQARSFIKGTPACNAENGSCIKCTVTGEWDPKGRHMSYPRIHCPRRTDKSFRDKEDDDHHKEDTPLTKLPIDMIEDFVVADSLHLLDLGIMRRCLYGWREGSYNFRTKLSRIQADLLSEMLVVCNKNRPLEIQRAIRSLKTLKFWKGSEYRVFLLYLGVVVLKDFLSIEVYEHFLTLHCAVTIVSCKEYLKYINIAKELLEDYIEKFIEIYGIDSISSNVHNLCHIIEDVKKFGPLPDISSYPFENSLGHLKSLVRHGNLPLSQISKRVIELSKLSNTEKLSGENCIHVKKQLNELHVVPMCKNVYKQIKFKDEFILSADNKNQFFMSNNQEIILMLNATYFNNQIYIYGKKLKSIYDFFKKPFASSKLNIFATKLCSQNQFNTDPPKLFSLNEVKCKLFGIPYHQDEFVFFPLLHTLDFNK